MGRAFSLSNDHMEPELMDDLILQGGALAVILCAFLGVLTWLLKHFTNALTRIEDSIHANTKTILLMSKVNIQTSLAPKDGHTDDALKQAYSDNLTTLKEIEAQLSRLLET